MIQVATGGRSTCPGHLTGALGSQPGKGLEGPTVWSQLLQGSEAGGLRQAMSYPGQVSHLQTSRAHDPTMCVDGTGLAMEQISGPRPPRV